MIGLATTRASRPAPARPRNGSASTTEAIASRITDAVIEHRLLPGAKLGEIKTIAPTVVTPEIPDVVEDDDED